MLVYETPVANPIQINLPDAANTSYSGLTDGGTAGGNDSNTPFIPNA